MIGIVAGATCRAALRGRTFLLLVVVYAVGVALAPVVGWISATDGRIVTTDLVFSLLSVVGVLVAVATGTALVHAEIQQRTLYTVLARPISRGQFVVGKYLGLSLALAMGQLAMLAIALAFLWIYGGPVSWYLALSGLLVLEEVLVMAAVSLALTSCSGPLLAALLSLAVYALGHAVHELPSYINHLQGGQQILAIALASLVPDLGGFAYRNDAVHGIAPGRPELVAAITGLGWIALLVTVAVGVLKRRQL